MAGKPVLFTAESIVMLGSALFFDIAEFFLDFIPVVGNIASVGLDVIAFIFIGGWMLIRGKGLAKKAGGGTEAIKWAKRLKWLKPVMFIIEMIPIVGSLPCWFLAVYYEIKHN